MRRIHILIVAVLIALPKFPLLQANNTSAISINEIFPNPGKGKSNDEWIELANTSSYDVEVGGLQLDDAEGGSKAWSIPPGTNIPAKGFLTIPKKISKLTLNNDHDEIRLFDQNQNILHRVSYRSSRPDHSFARISETTWLWEDRPTPNRQNHSYEELEGTIQTFMSESPTTFVLQLDDDSARTLQVEPSLIPSALARVTFTEGSRVKAVIKANAPEYYLKDFKILSTAPPGKQAPKPSPAFPLVLALLGGIFGLLTFIWLIRKEAL